MRQKISLKLTILIAIFFSFSLFCFAQEDMKFIKSPAFKSHQRPPAIFEHDKHNEKAEIYDCSVCHHVYENGKLVEGGMSVGQPCSDCHKLKKTKENRIPLMDAYHKQCITCHQKRKKGPLACGECHVKK
ncbi:cytochrome c3 family protein [Desulfothermus okinawensis JCM 13304]